MNQVIIEDTIKRYPKLYQCSEQIKMACQTIINCYENNGKVLVCGNGGSASDSEHIVGELMKGFLMKRPLNQEHKAKLVQYIDQNDQYLIEKLQYGLPAISLVNHNSLVTAVSNDNHGDLIFAQQVLGFAKENDILIGLSTSGNSKNVVLAFSVAKALNLKTIALTGLNGGKLKDLSDILIAVPETETYKVQELHLPVYHAICAVVEQYFFG
ncbi:SIS domain-containing protein [Caldicellulosiruptoraceae bacterium PP1]